MYKVLNLYAGIGGNRKLWEDVEVTAVEFDPKIAAIYQDFFPNDKVIVGDAHQYLLDHYKEFDFIWSSPPCPTHSRFNYLNNVQEGKVIKYPDMTLYQEIIFLQTWFEGKYCVENVISYYKPLIVPIESSSHYFWTNFYFKPLPNITRNIRGQADRSCKIDFDLSEYTLSKQFEKKISNNCTEHNIGLHILNAARNIEEQVQIGLFEDI